MFRDFFHPPRRKVRQLEGRWSFVKGMNSDPFLACWSPLLVNLPAKIPEALKRPQWPEANWPSIPWELSQWKASGSCVVNGWVVVVKKMRWTHGDSICLPKMCGAENSEIWWYMVIDVKWRIFQFLIHDRCLNSILIHMLPSRNSEVPSRWLGDDVFHSYFFTQNTLGMGREKMRSVSPVWLAHVFSQLGGEQPSTWKISVSHLTSCTICNQRLLRLKTSLEERPVFNFFCLIHTLLN